GGAAGMTEALACHPLDTIKTRMQLALPTRHPDGARLGIKGIMLTTIRSEGARGLYRGLGIVLMGMIPKVAIRFSTFEMYQQLLADKTSGQISGPSTFAGMFRMFRMHCGEVEALSQLLMSSCVQAGLAAGLTEAVSVVTPIEVIKIRLQARGTGVSNRAQINQPCNGTGIVSEILRVDGFSGLYRGILLTMLRQGSNQAVSLSTYTYAKGVARSMQPDNEATNLPSWQTSLIGLLSGAMGPLSNHPIDTLKTRLQNQYSTSKSTFLERFKAITVDVI
ncbi:MAG: hypothetical protein LQ341_007178, partial [Variospora aurantia]